MGIAPSHIFQVRVVLLDGTHFTQSIVNSSLIYPAAHLGVAVGKTQCAPFIVPDRNRVTPLRRCCVE